MLGEAIAAVALSLLGGNQAASVIPTPIGVGARYRLAAAPRAIRDRHAVAGMRCRARRGGWSSAHVEVFAQRRVVVIPAGIGIGGRVEHDGAYVAAGRCSYPVRTVAPTGVVQIERRARRTVGDLFDLWGQRLDRRRLAGFRGRVHAFVGGRPWRGDVGAIPLRHHAQIVLEVGGYVPPHPLFLFADGA